MNVNVYDLEASKYRRHDGRYEHGAGQPSFTLDCWLEYSGEWSETVIVELELNDHLSSLSCYHILEIDISD